ncbi:antitoxin VapB family protein [Natrinema gelatinilyticum]|uniref:antitoxin VapB family protein n=1 Tax=Natrinema gelatinilyticum TaxID=2961571 RepID=UPI0020C3B2AC|nr:antitoxin VapB family protein [Natrinema gelatinilyticum]
MGTKTISLADDAYERLRAEKRENESFSDVVRRLTEGATLEEYYGALREDTADELEGIVSRRRTERTNESRDRVERIADALE